MRTNHPSPFTISAALPLLGSAGAMLALLAVGATALATTMMHLAAM